MNIRVIGAGGLGMLVGANLTRMGANVELVTRTREQAQLVREQGLLVTKETDTSKSAIKSEPEAAFTVTPAVLSFEEAAAAAGRGQEKEATADLILLMVKQTAITDELARGIKEQLKPSSRLICFQNGIGHTELLMRHIPAEQLLVAVTTEGALRRSPRHVAHTGSGTTWLGGEGSFPLTENDKVLVKKLQNLLHDAGFSVSLSNNITSKVWNKLLINAVINPLTAILQVRNGLLLQLPASLALMRSLYEEGVMLADKLDVELAPDLWDQLLAVCEHTANNRSSMLQDVLSRKPTEVDAITGGLLDKARGIGVQLPMHKAMYHLLRSIEQQWARI